MLGEARAFGNKPLADAEAAGRRLDQQQAQLRDAGKRLLGRVVARLHEQHAADVGAVALGDPAGFALRVEAIDEVGGDARHQRFEVHVPAVFLRIQRTVARDHPSDVARAVRSQQVRRACSALGRVVEQASDEAERLQQLLLLRLGQRVQQCRNLASRAGIQRRESTPTGGREAQVQMARIVLRASALHQAALLEAAQQAAQIAGIEIECTRELGRGRGLAMRKLPQQPRFGQREARMQQSFVQHADAARVEAVEGTHPLDAVGGGRGRGRIRHARIIRR